MKIRHCLVKSTAGTVSVGSGSSYFCSQSGTGLFTPFGDDNLAISRIYRDLGCSHCLVQERIDRLPDIPALMIDGFERWMMLMIMAWPEREFERLNKALLKMPISNPDDNTKNPPKNISRTLLPSSGDADWSVIIKRTILKHRHLQTTKNPVCFNCGKLRQECRYMCCLENHLKNSTKMKASRDPQGGYSPGSSDYAEFTDYQLEIAYEDRRSQFPEHFDTANDFLDFLVLRNVSNVQKRFSQTEIEAVVDSIMLVREYCNRIPKRRRSNSHDSFHSATHSHHSGQYSSYHPERESPGVF